MDTVTASAQRRPESVSAVATATLEQTRTLAVAATYVLAEDGGKASLLAGGNGREMQELIVQAPTNRLHLVSVDANGVARLKLRPRYQFEGEQRIIRIDSPPVYDAPPDLEDLFREAARHHQLERAYETERLAERERRREGGRERRAPVARPFLDDPAQRALVPPSPTPKRRYLATQPGRLPFDATPDRAPAPEAPPAAPPRL